MNSDSGTIRLLCHKPLKRILIFCNFIPENFEELRSVSTQSLYCYTIDVNDFVDNARTFISFMNSSALFSKKEKKITRRKGSTEERAGKDIADNRCSDRMTDRPCVFVPRPLLGSICSFSSFFFILILASQKNAIDKHRSESQQKRLLFIPLFSQPHHLQQR